MNCERLIGGHMEASENIFDIYNDTSLNSFYIRFNHILKYMNDSDINLNVKPWKIDNFYMLSVQL